jgi:uncharacterized protein DUF4255
MSNALAIAATTASLRRLLHTGIQSLDKTLTDLEVTAQPLDRARTGITTAQLNLFLYQTVLNGAWRNMEHPRQLKPGESGVPPLALNLHYVLTAYGRGESDNDAVSHRVLGGAMSVLHDHPLLGADEIKAALADNDLYAQLERVRIVPQPMTLEEMSKLWTAFQTNYRLSSAYEVSVLLIESNRPAATPLPVLTRGKDDSGVLAQADLESPFPTLTDVVIPNAQPSARAGERITLTGSRLDGTTVGVLLQHRRWSEPVEVPPAATGSAAVDVVVPSVAAAWPAGFYTAAVAVQRPNESFRRTTNAVSFALAPRVTGIAPDPAARNPSGDVSLTLTLVPDVLPEQRAALLLGGREVLARAHPTLWGQLTFDVKDAVPGVYPVRLRLDGVDSILVDRAVVPPRFDPTQRVTIT